MGRAVEWTCWWLHDAPGGTMVLPWRAARVGLRPGSRGSHAEPCSPAAASGRPVAHQVCPAVLMTPFGGVFRAVRSTEHDVGPVPIIFHRWRLTRRRGGRAWDRRVRPLRRAGAAPDFPRRRCTILEVPGEFRRTGGSRWAHPRCADVCTPSARAWGNNPKSTVRAPVSPQERLPRRLHRRMDTPSRPRSAAPSGGGVPRSPRPGRHSIFAFCRGVGFGWCAILSNRFHHKAHLGCQKKHAQPRRAPPCYPRAALARLVPPPPSWLGELIRAIILSSCAPSVMF